MLYPIVIIVASLIIGVVNYFFNFQAFDGDVLNIVFAVSVSVVAAIIIDGLFATLVRWILPKKFFSVDKEHWAAKRKECRFYEKIGIKKWKDKVIELGAFTGFRKNKIADPSNNEYVERYIVEANYGVGVHITGVLFGYLVCLLFPTHWYSVGLPVGVVNMVLNGMSLMILRYNLPKLRTLYRINNMRKARAEKAEQNQKQDAQSAV